MRGVGLSFLAHPPHARHTQAAPSQSWTYRIRPMHVMLNGSEASQRYVAEGLCCLCPQGAPCAHRIGRACRYGVEILPPGGVRMTTDSVTPSLTSTHRGALVFGQALRVDVRLQVRNAVVDVKRKRGCGAGCIE